MVDSAILIDLLRQKEDPRLLLLPVLRDGGLYNCGVIRAEVLRGMKTPRAHDGMQAFFDIVPEVACDAKLWQEVSRLGWELGRVGKWAPLTDLVIAACCARVRATLVSPDVHFEEVPGLSVVKELPNDWLN